MLFACFEHHVSAVVLLILSTTRVPRLSRMSRPTCVWRGSGRPFPMGCLGMPTMKESPRDSSAIEAPSFIFGTGTISDLTGTSFSSH